MAMTAKLWSINGLATELGMDRRTVAKKLSGVRPSGTLNGSPAWHLTVALEAIQGRRQQEPEQERPPLLQGMLIGNNAAIYVLPESVATAAVDCGLSMDKAYELADKVTLAAMARVAEFFGKPAQAWMSPAGRSRIYEADCLGAIDWRSLAERAGEPTWTPPAYSSAPGQRPIKDKSSAMPAASNGLWSVNALALEFDMDRRTVTQILRSVRPAGRLKGHPVWGLRDAALALLRYGSTSPTMSMRRAQADHRRAHAHKRADGLEEELDPEAPPCPAGLELVRQAENPIDKGFALAATMAGAEVPRLVTVQAVDKGLPVAEAYDLANTVLLVLGAIVGKRAASLGIEPWASFEEPDLDGPVLGEGMFTLINWPSLAHQSGAPDWTPPTYFGPWIELSPERRAELLAQGMAEDEAFAAELAAEENADDGPSVK